MYIRLDWSYISLKMYWAVVAVIVGITTTCAISAYHN